MKKSIWNRLQAQKSILLPALFFYSIMIVLALFWKSQKNFDLLWFPKKSVQELGIDFGIGLVCVVFFVGMSRFFHRFQGVIREMEKQFSSSFRGLQKKELCILALWSGVGEELLFRGCIQPYFGWIVTGTLFGVLHTSSYQDSQDRKRWLWPWTCFALLFGWVIGFLFEQRQGIFLPVFVHVSINAINLVWLSQLPCEQKKVEQDEF